MTEFIRSIVNFLLIHESFVISNYIILNGYMIYHNFSTINNQNPGTVSMQFPVVCSYVNSLNNM